jgi:predicted nucleic acid-binding protein
MSDKYFLDTNVFVYCFDRSDRRKQERADRLVSEAVADQLGVISTQVVQEFSNVALRKFRTPMTPAECRIYLEAVLTPLCEVFPTLSLYNEALRLHETTKLSFYDCLIIASAISAGCRILYSEDFQAEQVIDGLIIRNPFAAGRIA